MQPLAARSALSSGAQQSAAASAQPRSKTRRCSRSASSPYWRSGPDDGVTVEGMRSREELDAWVPPHSLATPARGAAPSGPRIILKILEVCSGCGSVSAAAAKEARENFGVHDVQIFSVDGKPGAGATRTVDLLTYDWANDAQLRRFRESEEGATCIYYAHASPPCGPYSCMVARPMAARDLRWGDSVAQRCLELIAFFRPDYWTLESRGPPGLDSRCFMRSLEPMRATVTYCRYGWQRHKPTSIWTNVSWRPEPKCTPSNCCAHFAEHGRHLDTVRRAANAGCADFAALPEQLVRSWTHAALGFMV